DWCYPICKNDRGETDMFRSAYTTKEYVATAMYAYSTDVMSRVCAVLGKTEQQNHYQILNEKIRKAFSDEYVNGDGTIGGAVQGVYVLALAMKMAEGEKLKNMAARLAEMIAANDDRLDTGFLSIEHLLDVLTEYGYQDIARRLLYQERCPSWLYEINSGATTIWETWNAVLEDGTPTDNSFNHYAFGCVGDWMYRNLLGIKRVKPGYEEFLIKPDFSYGLVWAKGAYQSRYGRIECQWHLDGNQGELAVTVPVGTRAVMEAGEERMEVGSGSYVMKFQLTAGRECA
uniref:alpha-L-rhamnosidase-related protein n=1 Tax=Hungatella effluvii TaxID=1096246 RepID=UPI002A83A5AE